MEQRTAAWFAAREGKVTASNAGALLGLVSYTSRAAAYARLRGLDTFTGNAACDWGVAMEAHAVEQYSKLTSHAVEATGLHVHPNHTWLAASPDGLVGDGGLVEVKCPYYSALPHDRIPLSYYIQMQLQLACTRREWCDFVSWTQQGMRVYRVVYDADLFDYLLSCLCPIYEQSARGDTEIKRFAPGERQKLVYIIDDSMSGHVDYSFWGAEMDVSDCDISKPEQPEYVAAFVRASA